MQEKQHFLSSYFFIQTVFKPVDERGYTSYPAPVKFAKLVLLSVPV